MPITASLTSTLNVPVTFTTVGIWWADCFKIVDSKNAVCVPTNRDYIDSMVNKINSTCTIGVQRLGFMKIDLISASITHGVENRVDSCHILLLFAKKKLLLYVY